MLHIFLPPQSPNSPPVGQGLGGSLPQEDPLEELEHQEERGPDDHGPLQCLKELPKQEG